MRHYQMHPLALILKGKNEIINMLKAIHRFILVKWVQKGWKGFEFNSILNRCTEHLYRHQLSSVWGTDSACFPQLNIYKEEIICSHPEQIQVTRSLKAPDILFLSYNWYREKVWDLRPWRTWDTTHHLLRKAHKVRWQPGEVSSMPILTAQLSGLHRMLYYHDDCLYPSHPPSGSFLFIMPIVGW